MEGGPHHRPQNHSTQQTDVVGNSLLDFSESQNKHLKVQQAGVDPLESESVEPKPRH